LKTGEKRRATKEMGKKVMGARTFFVGGLGERKLLPAKRRKSRCFID